MSTSLHAQKPAPAEVDVATPRHTEVSVVICAYTEDRWDQMLDALRSAAGQEIAPREIVLVIDDNLALLGRAEAELSTEVAAVVKVVPNVGAPGLPGARNSGVAEVTAPVVAFLDDDAVAPLDWTKTLLDCFGDSSVLVAGTDVAPAFSSGDRPAWFPPAFDWVVGCCYEGMTDGTDRAEVRNVIGASMAVRTEVFRDVAGCTAGMGHIDGVPQGGDETDLCLRIVERFPEGRIVLDRSASVRHFVPEGRTTWRYLASRCFHEGVTKACILATRTDAFGPESGFMTKTVPLTIARSLRSAAAGRPAELGRIGAIAVGVGSAGIGFAAACAGIGAPGERRRAVAGAGAAANDDNTTLIIRHGGNERTVHDDS